MLLDRNLGQRKRTLELEKTSVNTKTKRLFLWFVIPIKGNVSLKQKIVIRKYMAYNTYM